MSVKSLYRSKKYGLVFSFTDSDKGVFYSSSKWLLARWYLHGSGFIKIKTSFHTQNKDLSILKNYIVFYGVSDYYSINKFLSFNPSLNVIRLSQLYRFRLSLLGRFKK